MVRKLRVAVKSQTRLQIMKLPMSNTRYCRLRLKSKLSGKGNWTCVFRKKQ